MEDIISSQKADSCGPPPHKSSGSLLGNIRRRDQYTVTASAGISESKKSPVRAFHSGFHWAPLSCGECISTAVLVLLIYLVLSVQHVSLIAKQSWYAIESIASKQASDSESPPLVRDAIPSPFVVGSHPESSTAESPRQPEDEKLKKAFFEEMAKGDVRYEHVCGRQWRRQHANLQKEILGRGADEPRRFVVSRPYMGGGIGDRVIGIVTLFVNALLTKRAFIIDWEGVEEFLAPNEIDWRFSPQLFSDPLVDNLTPRGQTFWKRKFTPGIAEIMSMTDKIALIHGIAKGGVPSLEWFRNGTDTHDVVIAKSNRGTLLNYYNDPATAKALMDLGLYPPFAFGCVLRYLFRPSEKILAGLATPAGAELMNPTNFRVGIHVRMGDGFFEEHEITAPEELTGDILFECAKRVTDCWAPPGKKVVWFFMTDSVVLRRAMKAKHGDKVLTTDVTPTHIMHTGVGQQEALFSGLLEWYMFSLNDFFVFTESGLTKSASFFSLHQTAAFQFPRRLHLQGAEDLDKFCVPSEPKSIFEFTGWSGL